MALNYGTVKRRVGTEASRYEASSLVLVFRSQQLTCKIVYTCINVISPKRSIAIGNFDKYILVVFSFEHSAAGKFSGER